MIDSVRSIQYAAMSLHAGTGKPPVTLILPYKHLDSPLNGKAIPLLAALMRYGT